MTTVERDNEAAAPKALDPQPQFGGETSKNVNAAAALTASGNEEQKDDGREYVVLRRLTLEQKDASPLPEEWGFVASIEATSAQQAVRKAAETPGTSFLDPEGTVVLVAIPSRSFNPITVGVTTTTTITLS